MIKPLNDRFEIKDLSKLEERLADELEDRLELACWTNCKECNDRG